MSAFGGHEILSEDEQIIEKVILVNPTEIYNYFMPNTQFSH